MYKPQNNSETINDPAMPYAEHAVLSEYRFQPEVGGSFSDRLSNVPRTSAKALEELPVETGTQAGKTIQNRGVTDHGRRSRL